MADSKVTIQIDANAEDAKKALRDVGASAQDAMQRGAEAAKRMATSMDGVSKSAGRTASVLRQVATGMAGIAMQAAGGALRGAGNDKGADYLEGAGTRGAQALIMSGFNPGAGLLGAGMGAIDTWMRREQQGREQKQAQLALADSFEEARTKADAATARIRELSAIMDGLADTTRSASERESARAAAIARYERQATVAERNMKDTEADIRRAANGIDGPMTREQQRTAEQARRRWTANADNLASARTALDRLRGAKITEAPKGGAEGQTRFDAAVTSLEKLGIGVNAAADNIARSSLSVQEESRDYLRQIAEQRSGAFVFQ